MTLESRAYRKGDMAACCPFLVLCYVVAYLDRVNIGFARLQMLDDLGFSETVYGLGAGMFFIGYFLPGVPSNLILHRIGARLWIGRIMITWGLVSAALHVHHDAGCVLFAALSAWRLGSRILSRHHPVPDVLIASGRERRVRMIALFMTAVPIAGVIGSPLSGWIMESFAGVARLGRLAVAVPCSKRCPASRWAWRSWSISTTGSARRLADGGREEPSRAQSARRSRGRRCASVALGGVGRPARLAPVLRSISVM